MFEVIYSSTTQFQGKPVPVSVLNDLCISFEGCLKLEDYQERLDGHDDFVVIDLLDE